MTAFFIYGLKVCGCSAFFAAIYWILLRNGRFYRFNRYYLLSAVLLSALLPLPLLNINITLQEAAPLLPIERLWEVVLEPLTIYAGKPAETSGTNIVSISTAVIYLAVCCGLLIISTIAAIKLLRLQRNPVENTKGVKIYSIRDNRAPFSFFSSIFWRDDFPLHSAEGQCVLQHEIVHVRERHSIDKLFLQIACSLLWFNPFFWLLRRELNLTHEFIADRECVAGNDTGRLSALILSSVYPQHYMFFINPFFQTNIKRRIIMLSNTQLIKFNRSRQLTATVLSALFFVISMFSIETQIIAQTPEKPAKEKLQLTARDWEEAEQKLKKQLPTEREWEEAAQQKQEKRLNIVDDTTHVMPYSIVEVKPKFMDGDENEFTRWVFKQLKYPKEAQEKKLEGRVILRFVINKAGKVEQVKVQRGIDPLLDDEAVRVIKSSPDWTPGKHKGKTVATKYTFPVIFQLK